MTAEAFPRLCEMAAAKKPALADTLASGALRLVRFAEGPCAQVIHAGGYDDEPATVDALAAFIADQGLETDIPGEGEPGGDHGAAAAGDPAAMLGTLDADGTVPPVRLHHEIYLGDLRKTSPDRLKTVIRHPVRPR